ncbi:hypothetical protein [Actinokineospora spheciospongiae]|uniref:hypothetical protein n=1 Tax=Actinokineospora spheciospongiae TaxID=909613 RepID=UPI000D712EC6|nr:hypothetical protein [Actinokineospora spheciospongiae]PWW63057.1 hypothetical protein DFQ13_10447 [Actinokineospora spheciospongiae]
MTAPQPFTEVVLITGATSGLGAARTRYGATGSHEGAPARLLAESAVTTSTLDLAERLRLVAATAGRLQVGSHHP